MGFLDSLKKDKVPNELPDLAIDVPVRAPQKELYSPVQELPVRTEAPKPLVNLPASLPVQRIEDRGPEQLTFHMPDHIKSFVEAGPPKEEEHKEGPADLGDLSKESYFNQILEDINGEISDLGNLEDWYNKKFLPQDVVSNMRGFWEGNKSEMIIKSFGSDYKKKINQKISKLQELEMDWREIYFKLIKKEEEMKKEERELKETLSEFVDLCKQRRKGDEE